MRVSNGSCKPGIKFIIFIILRIVYDSYRSLTSPFIIIDFITNVSGHNNTYLKYLYGLSVQNRAGSINT